MNPAALTITASSGTTTYEGTPPTITPIYNGFVNGDNASKLTTQPACTTTATSTSNAGSYPSSCAGASDPNYAISYVPGSVTINKANVNIATTSNQPNPSVTGQPITVSFKISPVPPATTMPTGDVGVKDDKADSGIETVATGHVPLSIFTAGSRTLTATYYGDTNFNVATSASVPQTVNKADTTIAITSVSPGTTVPGPYGTNYTAVAGQPVTFYFKLTVVAPGSEGATGAPTGNVTVANARGVYCTASAGSGRCVTSFSEVTDYMLDAVYPGDSNYNSSVWGSVMEDIRDFAMNLDPSTSVLGPGKYLLKLTSLNQFSGMVALSCNPGLEGTTCEFTPNPVSLDWTPLDWTPLESRTFVTVVIQMPKGAPAGTWPLDIVGTYGTGDPSTGGLTHTISVNLTYP